MQDRTKEYPYKVAIVTPVHNGREETLAFLHSLSCVTYSNLEIIIVDDGSTDGSENAIRAMFPDVIILEGDGDLWWTGATNLGIKAAISRGADFVLTINNDNIVLPDFIEPLVTTAHNHPKSLVNSKIFPFEHPGRICSFGGEIKWLTGKITDRNYRTRGLDFDKLQECDFLTGNSMLIPVEVFEKIGFFDKYNCPQYLGDTEFTLRAKRHGYRLLVQPASTIYRKKTAPSGGNKALMHDGPVKLITGQRSPYYFKANRKIYHDYCPYKPVFPFIAIRYCRLFYNVIIRLMRKVSKQVEPNQYPNNNFKGNNQ